jgi:heptosyltransferase-2
MTPIPPHAGRVLVVCPSWIGDTVMATLVLRAIRQARPQAQLVAWVRPGLEALLAGLPWLDEILASSNRGALGPLRTASIIRRQRCDVALLLPNSLRAALTLRLAGVPRRIGHRRDWRGPLLTHRLAPPRDRPIAAVEYYARLAEWALGVERIERRPELVVTEGETRAANDLLHGIKRPLLVLNPGANRPDKRWPARCFAQAAAAIRARHDLDVAVTGAATEAEVLEAVIEAAPPECPIVNLAERGIGLGSLKAVLGRAALIITNDTGPRHIAAALGTPVVSLFGPTDHRWTTLAHARERVLLAEPFLPAELLADDHRKACAIERIPVADVVAAAESLLRT